MFNVWFDIYVLFLQIIAMSEENQEMVKLKVSRSSFTLNWFQNWLEYTVRSNGLFESIICRNDELNWTMSWVGCSLKDSELFVSFAENSQIPLKISVIPILLTFMYLVVLESVSKQPTQLIIAADNWLTY